MHNDALHLNNYDSSTLNILLVVHIIIHYKTCHQEVEIYRREHLCRNLYDLQWDQTMHPTPQYSNAY